MKVNKKLRPLMKRSIPFTSRHELMSEWIQALLEGDDLQVRLTDFIVCGPEENKIVANNWRYTPVAMRVHGYRCSMVYTDRVSTTAIWSPMLQSLVGHLPINCTVYDESRKSHETYYMTEWFKGPHLPKTLSTDIYWSGSEPSLNPMSNGESYLLWLVVRARLRDLDWSVIDPIICVLHSSLFEQNHRERIMLRRMGAPDMATLVTRLVGSLGSKIKGELLDFYEEHGPAEGYVGQALELMNSFRTF